jgi:hypothetical protein
MDPQAHHSEGTIALYMYWVPELQGLPNKYTLLISLQMFLFCYLAINVMNVNIYPYLSIPKYYKT